LLKIKSIIIDKTETKHIPNNVRNIIKIESKRCLDIIIIIQNVGITITGKIIKNEVITSAK
jgi:hypothetical protein